MAMYHAVAALLWVLLAAVCVVIAVVLFRPGAKLSGWERAATVAVMLLLGIPLARAISRLHANMREMRANYVVLEGDGIHVRLTGELRAQKALPPVSDTVLPWSEITGVYRERRKFLSRSAVPFEYPLDVYTVKVAARTVEFTRECYPGAARVAREIALRIGQEVRKPAG